MCFQTVTDTRSDSLALIILMDIKAVKVSGIIDVSKACDNQAFFRNDCEMFRQCTMPSLLNIGIKAIRCPGIKLSCSVIAGTYGVNGVMKEPEDLWQVFLLILSEDHDGTFLL